MTYTANQTTEQCKMNGKTCAKYKYDESFTSIVSEVNLSKEYIDLFFFFFFFVICIMHAGDGISVRDISTFFLISVIISVKVRTN